MRINELFVSLSGETDGWGNQGGLATFVKLQGCNLRCSWCDAPRAQDPEGGNEASIDKVLEWCETKHVVITGGEPLLQVEEVAVLAGMLSAQGKRITIETNGSFYPFFSTVPRYVVDYKLGKSGMSEKMLLDIYECLRPEDVIKFVVADLQDYREAKALIHSNPQWKARKVLSPVLPYCGEVMPEFCKLLANVLVEDQLEEVTLSLQYHKLLDLR